MSKKARQSSSLRLRGKVLAFNISPKGQIEGALVETANGTAQINFPKRDVETLARSMSVGSTIDIEAELETDSGDHLVYRICDEAVKACGTVIRLNYEHHGEVNGFHLDDGTFVHIKPEGAKKYRLHVGDKVTATGSRRTGNDAVVMEARAIER